jgi:cytochrome c peroxidase
MRLLTYNLIISCVREPAAFSWFLLAATVSVAAPPQVPALPSQPAGYVNYAITQLPAHFSNGPVAATDNTPADNLLTDAGATLGRVLFYDKRLSHDNGVSCSSCHRQQNGFSDPNQFSTGINGQLTARHSMGLANSVYYTSGTAFWDERAGSLEEQALIPIESSREMGSTLSEVIGKLNQTVFYPVLFQAAFGTPDITPERIGRSIAQFERAMVSYQSKYDTAFAPGQTQPNFASVLTPQELAGEALFHGSARCSGCHVTNAHIGDQARNIGLDPTVVDPGADDGRFKTPSLRNVGVRGRFMHDGRFASLEEVVEFYNSGVNDSPALDFTLTDPLQLGLTPQQVQALVAYLNTLTDNVFLNSSLFSNPFKTLVGDYDGNGEVNSADYAVWKANAGDTTLLTADGNGDNVVDGADYVLWRKNVGRSWQNFSPGSGAGFSAAVPEPSISALVSISVVWIMFWRARRPRSDRG